MWTDVYKPQTLDQLSFNDELTQVLKGLTIETFPNMILVGPDGCGKQTRIECCLNEIFNLKRGVSFKRNFEYRHFKLPSKKMIEVMLIVSDFHVEIDVSRIKYGKKIIIQEISDTLNSGTQSCFENIQLKIIVLRHAECLTAADQYSLCRTIEKYSETCRFVLLTSSASKIVEPLHSYCLMFRVGVPSRSELIGILEEINTKESVGFSTNQLTKIAENNAWSIENASIELQKRAMGIIDDEHDTTIDYKDFIERNIVKLIVNTPKTTSRNIINYSQKVVKIRKSIYEVMGKCIEPMEIFLLVVQGLLNQVVTEKFNQIVKAAAYYEHQMLRGGKAIIHFEAFVVRCMEILQSSLK